jgi:outer membrane protein TolC
MLLQGQNQLTQANLEYLKKYEDLALLQYSAGSSPASSPSSFSAPNPRSAATSSTGNSQMSQMGGSNSASSSPTTMSASMPRTTMNAGISGMSTVLQIRLQVKELEARLQQLQANSELLRIQFNQVLGRPMTAAIQLPETWEQPNLLLEKQEYLDKILQNHPMISMYASENLALAQQGKMAKLEGKPMLGAGVNYMPFTPRIENGMSMGGDDMVMPMVSLSLPIYRKKIAAKIKEVELLQGATTLKQQETENDLSLSWAAAFRDWEDSKRQLALYSEQVALIQQQIQLLETSFTTGAVSLLELLQTQQLLLEYQEKQLLAQYQGHQSVARLEALFSTTSLN